MKCGICGKGIPKGKGKMFVKNTGQILIFCSSKCQKNWNMGREGKKLKWVVSEKKVKKKS